MNKTRRRKQRARHAQRTLRTVTCSNGLVLIFDTSDCVPDKSWHPKSILDGRRLGITKRSRFGFALDAPSENRLWPTCK